MPKRNVIQNHRNKEEKYKKSCVRMEKEKQYME